MLLLRTINKCENAIKKKKKHNTQDRRYIMNFIIIYKNDCSSTHVRCLYNRCTYCSRVGVYLG